MKKITNTPAIIATMILVISFFDVPYGYYNFLKFVVMCVSVYYAYLIYGANKKVDGWTVTMGAIAVLFNPFVPIVLGDKGLWVMVDIIVIVIYFSMLNTKNK